MGRARRIRRLGSRRCLWMEWTTVQSGASGPRRWVRSDFSFYATKSERLTPPPLADAHLLPYLTSLPPSPHNSVTLLTSLSPSTLLSLFDLASPPPSSPTPTNPPTIPAHREHTHGLIYRLLASFFSLALKALLLIALFVLGKRLWARYQTWKAAREGAEGAGRVRLGDDEVHVDLGSDEEEEEGEGDAPWRIGGRADGR